jgi:hypothetical protein
LPALQTRKVRRARSPGATAAEGLVSSGVTLTAETGRTVTVTVGETVP